MTKDFMQLCMQRQSCRKYDGRQVELEKLEKMMQAVRLTPSGCNSQPWSFIVVHSADLVAEVAKCGQVLGNNEWADDAGAFLVVVEEHARVMPAIRRLYDSQVFAKGDLGAAVYAATLAAEDLGVASCIIGCFDRMRLRELLNIPEEKSIFMMVALGYSADEEIREKKRKPLEEIVRFV